MDAKFLEGFFEKYDRAIEDKNIYMAFQQVKKLGNYFKMIKSRHGVFLVMEMHDLLYNCMSKIHFSKKESYEVIKANEILDKIHKVLEYCKIEELNDDQKLELYNKLEEVNFESELLQQSIDESRPPSPRDISF